MSTQAALLAGIESQPECVIARLVYADFLDEFGSEGDWQDYLDAHPNHHEMRARFGAWLAGRGDERSGGYRVLAALGRIPRSAENRFNSTVVWFWSRWNESESLHIVLKEGTTACMPYDWYQAWGGDDVKMDSRRECEDAAARAFALLPAERRAELLADGCRLTKFP